MQWAMQRNFLMIFFAKRRVRESGANISAHSVQTVFNRRSNSAQIAFNRARFIHSRPLPAILL